MRRNLRLADPRLRHATFRPRGIRAAWIKERAKAVEEFRWFFLAPLIVILAQVTVGDSAAERTLWLQVLGVFTLGSALIWLMRAIRLRVHQRLRDRFATTIARVKGRP